MYIIFLYFLVLLFLFQPNLSFLILKSGNLSISSSHADKDFITQPYLKDCIHQDFQ